MRERSRKRWRKLATDHVRHEAYIKCKNERDQLRRKRRARRVEKEKKKRKRVTVASYVTFARGFPRYRGYPNTNMVFHESYI